MCYGEPSGQEVIRFSQLKPSFSQSLSLHSHLSLAHAYLLEFDHSWFDSHWEW